MSVVKYLFIKLRLDRGGGMLIFRGDIKFFFFLFEVITFGKAFRTPPLNIPMFYNSVRLQLVDIFLNFGQIALV